MCMRADQCNGYHQTVTTLTRGAGGADQSSSVSGGGTGGLHGGRPTSASADRSTSTDLISPDLTSACPDVTAAAAVFRPIRRPYGTVSSSQDEDFSFFDTEDDDDDDLRYNGASPSNFTRPIPNCNFYVSYFYLTRNKERV